MKVHVSYIIELKTTKIIRSLFTYFVCDEKVKMSVWLSVCLHISLSVCPVRMHYNF